MILGLSSFAFAWSIGMDGAIPRHRLTAMDLVNKSLALGLSCVQVGDNLPLHTLSAEDLARLHDLSVADQIRLEVGARKLTEENLQRYIDIAARLNSPLLRFVIDGPSYQPPIEEVTGLIRNYLPLLKQHDLVLGIENHDRFKATELASMMDHIGDDRVGICLDCVNSLGAGEGLEWVVNILSPYTVNLHIKDFIIRRFYHNMGFEVLGTAAGQGSMDIHFILEKLSAHHRCKSAVLEQWISPQQSIDQAVLLEDQWARQGVEYLRAIPDLKN